MRAATLVVYLILVAGLVGILESGAADVVLEVTRPDFQKIPIGLLPFREGATSDRVGQQVLEVLAADLRHRCQATRTRHHRSPSSAARHSR
jgi:TolB protein